MSDDVVDAIKYLTGAKRIGYKAPEITKRIYGSFTNVVSWHSLDDVNAPPTPVPSKSLNVTCWLCQKAIIPTQYWEFSEAINTVRMKCCNREENIKLTDEQIEKSNTQGTYWAFMC